MTEDENTIIKLLTAFAYKWQQDDEDMPEYMNQLIDLAKVIYNLRASSDRQSPAQGDAEP